MESPRNVLHASWNCDPLPKSLNLFLSLFLICSGSLVMRKRIFPANEISTQLGHCGVAHRNTPSKYSRSLLFICFTPATTKNRMPVASSDMRSTHGKQPSRETNQKEGWWPARGPGRRQPCSAGSHS